MLFVYFLASAVLSKPNMVYSSQEVHQLELISDGQSALAKRLQLINQAQRSIHIETYLFSPGVGNNFILQALQKRAREGIEVFILVDYSGAYLTNGRQYPEQLQQLGDEMGFKVKFFNILKTQANFRNHRKTFCIDEGAKGCIVGGRNFADEYWLLSKKYNHLDREVFLEGPLTRNVHSSFLNYWNSSYSSRVSYTRRDISKLYSLPESAASQTVQSINSKCSDLLFISDPPSSRRSNRITGKFLKKYLLNASSEVLLESPYFIVKGSPLGHALEKSLDKGVKISALISGENTTAFKILNYWNEESAIYFSRLGMQVYRLNEEEAFFEFKDFKVHSKTVLIDPNSENPIVWISSYNLDPRSAAHNSELALACIGNKELALEVKTSMLAWQDRGHKVTPKCKPSLADKFIRRPISLPVKNIF